MSSLRTGGLRQRAALGEDVSPMESAANIVDAMLVFACGLLLALITYWGLDLPDIADLSQAREVQDVETASADADAGDESGYDQLGVVYQDPETGRMFLIEEG